MHTGKEISSCLNFAPCVNRCAEQGLKLVFPPCSLTREQFPCGGSLLDVPLLGLFVNVMDSRESCPDNERSVSIVGMGGERLSDLTALHSFVKVMNIMQSLVTHAGLTVGFVSFHVLQ